MIGAWFFVLSLFYPGLCDTEACEAANGAVVAEVRAVDQKHCERIRKLVLSQFGKARDGRVNIDGEVTECKERGPQ